MTYLKVMDKSFSAFQQYIQLKQKRKIHNRLNSNVTQLLQLLKNTAPFEPPFYCKRSRDRFLILYLYSTNWFVRSRKILTLLDIIQVNKVKQNFVHRKILSIINQNIKLNKLRFAKKNLEPQYNTTRQLN
jgi:hypothetical protein